MKESLNVEGLRPVDIVNEKEDTEVKSKLLGMSLLIVRILRIPSLAHLDLGFMVLRINKHANACFGALSNCTIAVLLVQIRIGPLRSTIFAP